MDPTTPNFMLGADMEITSSASPTATGGYGGTSTENSPQNYIYQEPIPTATGPGGPGSGTRRACDQCRLRKIRCDKETPCANCRTSNRTCTSVTSQRPKEPKQRVLISSQYERKIDRIDERLGGIERLLRDLSPSSSGGRSPDDKDFILGPTSGDCEGVSPDATSKSPGTVPDKEDENSVYEGHYGMAAQAAWATDFLENATQRISLDTRTKVNEALSSLRQIVEMQSKSSTSMDARFPYRRQMPTKGLRALAMPPVHSTVSALRNIKDQPMFSRFQINHLLPLDAFASHCNKVYFAVDEYSESTFIIANTGLFYIFSEMATQTENPSMKEEYLRHSKLCRCNVETSLSQISLFQVPRLENIEALLIGATYTIESYRPSVAWVLIHQAAQLCQAMGLHRNQHARDARELRQRKSRLFWYTFILDKGLSMRLGRHPVLHYADVTTPIEDLGIPAGPQLDGIVCLWVKVAVIQGKSYEQLYSPAALLKPDEERVRCARSLLQELKSLFPHGVKDDSLVHDNPSWMAHSSKVDYLSTMAMICRALPPEPGCSGTFSAECIRMATKAIEIHTSCITSIENQDYWRATFVNWTILFSPLIPFMVIFSHSIETCDRNALKVLSSFVKSLESSVPLSEGIARIHSLVQVLYNVVVIYIEAKENSVRNQNLVPVGNEFDMYLGQLGFISPQVDATMGNTNTATFPAACPTSNVPPQAPQAAPLPLIPTTEFDGGGGGGGYGGWVSASRYSIEVAEQGVIEVAEQGVMADFNPNQPQQWPSHLHHMG